MFPCTHFKTSIGIQRLELKKCPGWGSINQVQASFRLGAQIRESGKSSKSEQKTFSVPHEKSLHRAPARELPQTLAPVLGTTAE